jgi:hypothetical protein
MAKYAEALEHNAAMKRDGGKKELSHMRISEAENGGHLVEHHFESAHEPEQHVFGAADGAKLLAHVAKHMNVKAAQNQEPEEE